MGDCFNYCPDSFTCRFYWTRCRRYCTIAVGIIDGGGSGDKAGVNALNELLTANTPQITYYDNVALGNVSGASIQPVAATGEVQDGPVNEQVVGDGMTVRYPFPDTAVQMDIVSTSVNDTLTGAGARVLFVRGNITGNVELFEAVLLSGTTTVTTTNDYLRVNSIGVVSVGASKSNEGVITLKNGADLLAQINIGKNLSHTAIFSVPGSTTGLLRKTDIFTGKDDNATIVVHSREPELNLIDFAAFEQQTYLNQISLSTLPFAVAAGADIEITAFSESGTGPSQIGVLFDILLIND